MASILMAVVLSLLKSGELPIVATWQKLFYICFTLYISSKI